VTLNGDYQACIPWPCAVTGWDLFEKGMTLATILCGHWLGDTQEEHELGWKSEAHPKRTNIWQWSLTPLPHLGNEFFPEVSLEHFSSMSTYLGFLS
jgi:hypothetical protein